MDIFDILIVFAIGYFVGKAHAYYKFASALREAADEAGIDLIKELKLKEDEDTEKAEPIYKLTVETINNVLYLYDRDTNDFICQGSTIEELAKMSKDYKNILLASVLHGEQVFMFINGVSKEFSE